MKFSIKLGNYLYILLLIAYIFLCYFLVNNNYFLENWSKTISVISFFSLIFQVIVLKFEKFRVWEYQIISIVLLHIFMFGRIYLNALELDDNIYWNLLNSFDNKILYNSSLIVLAGIMTVFVSFVLTKQKHSFIKDFNLIKKQNISALYNTGLILFLISLPFRLFEDIRAILLVQFSQSYSALNSTFGLFREPAKLFLPSLIFILVFLFVSHKRSYKTILLTSIAYFILIMIFTGDRRYQTLSILSILALHMYLTNIKLFTFKTIFYIIFAILFIDVLTILSELRLNEFTLNSFITNYGSEYGIIYRVFRSFGYSIFSVAQVYKYIPNIINYQYGLSFVGSIISILPIGWLLPGFFEKVSISNYLYSTTNIPTGGSIIGDSYANFGLFYIVFLLLFYMFISKIMHFSKMKNDLLKIVLYYSLFPLILNLVRASFFEIFRTVIIVTIVPIIVYKTQTKRIKKR
ncbi:O-antigen polymerase [Liberiplasma polymorphum]|uniref:O-antigen polymerase n=1 Tax=Liberiplasma polymorphum TaxID=3374570 RepID=UPI003771280C